MRFFDKRPLALILCSMICGFVAFTIGEVLLRITAICIIPLLLMFSVIIKRKRALFISVSVALMLSFLLSFLYFDIWYFPADRYDSDVTVSGTVCSVNEDDMTLLVLTDSIEGESVGSYKLLVEVDEYQLYAFSAGSKVEFRAELLSYGDKMSSDEKAALISDKINSYAALTSDIRLVSSGEKPLELLLSESREALGRRLMSLSDNESGRLLSALLLGEREMLDDSTVLGFRRLGITHILALSGMHLAILSLGLSKLLGLFGIGKRTASVFNIVFTILYMVYTGMPVSVVRAGIMLILNSLLRLAVGMNDPPTSLSVAVTLICIFDPTAVVDISLWLSALATLGVLTVSEHRNSTPIKNEKKRGNIFVFALKGAALSLITSALAVTSTILLCITCFRGFSLISPASTLVISPLIELIMYIGSLTLILGDILPIGKLLKPITHFTLWLIELISSADGIFVSTSYIIIRIFALVLTVAFALVLILKLKKVKLWLTALALGLCLFMTTGCILNRTNLADDSIVFADIDDSSCTLIKSQGEASLIYSDTYSRTRIYKPLRLLSEENICELDAVAFTHYSFGVPKALSDLAGSYKLKRVVLPKARCREERAILAMIKTRCSEFGITLEHFESREAMNFGSVGMTLNHSTVYGEDTIRAAYTLTEGESKTVYLSSGMLLEDYYKFSVKLCDGADTVILGTHGKSYKENVYMDRIFKSAKSILLCSDGLFLTQDAMADYTKYGCKIYSHPYKINIKD